MRVYFKGATPIDLVKDAENAVVYARNLLLNSNVEVTIKTWVSWLLSRSSILNEELYTSCDAIKTSEIEGNTQLGAYFRGVTVTARALSGLTTTSWKHYNFTKLVVDTDMQNRNEFAIHGAIGFPIISAEYKAKKVKLCNANEATYTLAPEDLIGSTTSNVGGAFT